VSVTRSPRRLGDKKLLCPEGVLTLSQVGCDEFCSTGAMKCSEHLIQVVPDMPWYSQASACALLPMRSGMHQLCSEV
jgi:hypothetical protein